MREKVGHKPPGHPKGEVRRLSPEAKKRSDLRFDLSSGFRRLLFFEVISPPPRGRLWCGHDDEFEKSR